MNLYFTDLTAIVTTLSLIGLLVIFGLLIKYQGKIRRWGLMTLLIDAFGLYICCMAATRDGLHLTIQNAIDQTTVPGIFPLISFPNIAGTIGAVVILVSGIISLFVHNQTKKKILCFTTIGGMVFKIVMVELSRIIM